MGEDPSLKPSGKSTRSKGQIETKTLILGVRFPLFFLGKIVRSVAHRTMPEL
jgi:hypothetical protein